MMILFACRITIANDLTRQSAVELETQAKQLSKIWGGDEIRRSILIFKDASKKWKSLGEWEKSSYCLREAAKLSVFISDNTNALPMLKKALSFDKKTNNFNGQAISYSLLSQIEEQKSNVLQRDFYKKKALRLSENSDDLTKAFVYLSSGTQSLNSGNPNEALEFLKKGLSSSNKTEELNLRAHILLNIGIAESIKGNKNTGLEKIREARSIWTEIDNKRGIAISYIGLGFIFTITNEKQNALENYQKAEQMFPEGVDLLEKAKLFGGLAAINYHYKKFDISEKYFREALTLYEKVDYEFGQLSMFLGLASIYYQNDNKAASNDLYKKALSLGTKLNNKFSLAQINEYLSLIDLDDGKYDEAISKLKKSQKVYRQLGIELPGTENRLGKAFEKKGEFKIAKDYYTSALKVNRKIKDTVEIAENLYDIARLSKKEGNLEKALKESEESLSFSESVYYDVGNNNLRSSYLSSVFERYELHINLLMKMHECFPEKGFDQKALQASEKSRSRLMLERLRLSEADLRRDADPILVNKEKEFLNRLNIKSHDLTQLLSNNGSDEEIDRITNEIKQIENDLEETKADLMLKSPIYSELTAPSEFDLKAFQQDVLNDETYLLEFSFGEEESYLWLIGKDSSKVFVLSEREVLENKIDKLRDLLIAHKNLHGEEIEAYQKRIALAETEFQTEAQILSNALFGQVADQISGKKLIIVPDKKLQYFPISALPLPNNNGNPVINEPFLMTSEIIYEPSASMLHLLRKTRFTKKEPLKDLLIFADPIFSKHDSRIASKSAAEDTREISQTVPKDDSRSFNFLSSLQRLPASKEESKAILETVGLKKSTLISDFAANREEFINADLGDYKIIHFATHGLLDEERPELSGIVLSLYDEQAKEIYGFIRLQDIYNLDLSANLVVLSACDTGIGKDIKGEGLMSINNGFLQVGASSVISSLWKVDDYATLELMKNFYQILADENVSPSQALNKAKKKMRENPRYSSPYYWAAFTIHGDIEQKPVFSKGLDYKFYIFLICGILGLLGMFVGIKIIKPRLRSISF